MQIDAPIQIILDIMESDQRHKMMVFFPTANMTSFYSQIFNMHLGKSVIEIHSRKSQAYRSSACNRFREKKSGVAMFTSDVSARGMDFSGVSHVIQVGMPDSRETYIHRLGRTGRAGKEGEGILILSEIERDCLTEHLAGLNIDKTLLAEETRRGTEAASSFVMASFRQIVGEGGSESIARAAQDAYASMLGYYASKLKSLGVQNKNKLVSFVNSFSAAAGLREPPSISAKVAESIGLRGVPGLSISSRKHTNGNGKGRRSSGNRRSRPKSNNHGSARISRDKRRSRHASEEEGVTASGSYDGWGKTKKW